ncbi:hypothetical protein QFW77_11330 [Luteimonas sp. RD2P54]|uniref:Uncharacterized protein n=1 Tax=Luteimonas endophytica TaxID=3042023 RepID=A0ABT6J9U1_9GAMM|nr:hypothetical protein [Luteimonas endophytica]MDH5823578.1 hypothetical protein [Luteimonas endophytica]
MRKALFVAAVALVSAAAQAGSPAFVMQAPQDIADRLGERELLERELAYELAPVKSEADLRSLLVEGAEGTPLAALSPGAQQRFLQSLVFSEAGLASFYYEDLRAELSPTQIYRLLSLFGAQRSTPSIPGLRVKSKADELIVTPQADGGDHQGYLCHSPGTCMESRSFICTHNC